MFARRTHGQVGWLENWISSCVPGDRQLHSPDKTPLRDFGVIHWHIGGSPNKPPQVKSSAKQKALVQDLHKVNRGASDRPATRLLRAHAVKTKPSCVPPVHHLTSFLAGCWAESNCSRLRGAHDVDDPGAVCADLLPQIYE